MRTFIAVLIALLNILFVYGANAQSTVGVRLFQYDEVSQFSSIKLSPVSNSTIKTDALSLMVELFYQQNFKDTLSFFRGTIGIDKTDSELSSSYMAGSSRRYHRDVTTA